VFRFPENEQDPEILEPLLFYILHRANSVITDRQISTSQGFFIDEAWVFSRTQASSVCRRGTQDLEEGECAI